MAQYYGVTRSGEELSHYGIKGMKWGVRKAILTGNERALNRHYRKAAKKLAKLTDIGLNSKKYAAKAAAYGAAAAGTGTLAVGGTHLAGHIVGKISSRIAPLYAKYAPKTKASYEQYLNMRDYNVVNDRVQTWGKKQHILPIENAGGEKRIISNDALYRAGAGLATAGLGAKSVQNAYRASHGAKYRAKAQAWKNEMDQAFKGTQYEGHYEKIKRKRRKRN